MVDIHSLDYIAIFAKELQHDKKRTSHDHEFIPVFPNSIFPKR